MKNLKKSVFILLSILSLAIFSCDSWMKDDDFFSDIENQVKVANAPKINVYVRYAMNRQGKPNLMAMIFLKLAFHMIFRLRQNQSTVLFAGQPFLQKIKMAKNYFLVQEIIRARTRIFIL